jgi:hypothetical protein
MDIHELKVSYGHPLVHQRRNPHDIVKDLEKELPGLSISDLLTAELRVCSRSIEVRQDIASTYVTLLDEILGRPICAKSDYLKVILEGSLSWCQDYLDSGGP